MLTREGAKLSTIEGAPIERAPRRIDWSPTQAEKGGYKHFMLKEIHEQPRAIEDTLRGRVDLPTAQIVAEEIGVSNELAARIGRVYFIACGTSSHAAMAGRYWVEQLARIPSVVEIGSEVRYRDPVFLKDDLVVAVSQSGETLDTLAAAKAAKAAGAHVLAVANVLDSAIPRMADAALYTHAGPEIGVASTKCFTTQLAALLLLAVHIGRRRGALDEAHARRIIERALARAPAQMRDVLETSDHARAIAKKHLRATRLPLPRSRHRLPDRARGRAQAEGDFVHPRRGLRRRRDEARSHRAHRRGHARRRARAEGRATARRSSRTCRRCARARGKSSQSARKATTKPRASPTTCCSMPDADPRSSRRSTVLPLQLLAYHMADLKGTDVDQPRNLAKTVTVE